MVDLHMVFDNTIKFAVVAIVGLAVYNNIYPINPRYNYNKVEVDRKTLVQISVKNTGVNPFLCIKDTETDPIDNKVDVI
jgi:hypothetical protein